MKRAYVVCRGMGHSWKHRAKPVTAKEFQPPLGGGMAGLASVCLSCTMIRVKWVTRSGEVINRYYAPDGYALHGEERLSPREWRAQLVGPIFAKADGS